MTRHYLQEACVLLKLVIIIIVNIKLSARVGNSRCELVLQMRRNTGRIVPYISVLRQFQRVDTRLSVYDRHKTINFSVCIQSSTCQPRRVKASKTGRREICLFSLHKFYEFFDILSVFLHQTQPCMLRLVRCKTLLEFSGNHLRARARFITATNR